MKPTILSLVHYYLPGFKSGGPIRSISNIVDQLGDEFNFLILTSDRDALDSSPYPNVVLNDWNQVGKAKVYYATASNLSFIKLVLLLKSTSYDVLYLNSFFDSTYSVFPLLARGIGLIAKKPVVIAPRGEFSEGALTFKRWKKEPFIALARAIGLHVNVTWQASSSYEAEDIRRVVGAAADNIVIAPNLPTLRDYSVFDDESIRDRHKPLRVMFLSRISPKKNLDYVLKVVARVQVPLQLDIYGPIRDEAYWELCKDLISVLPPNICVSYEGSIEHSEVPSVMASHDLFFLPTHGENFGHVILEALTAGTPVLISNTTPWRGLKEEGVGWDLPLDDINLFSESIQHASMLSADEYADWRGRARAYACKHTSDPHCTEVNRNLFMDAYGSDCD